MKRFLIPLIASFASIALPSSIEAESTYLDCNFGTTYQVKLDVNLNKKIVSVFYPTGKVDKMPAEWKEKDRILIFKEGSDAEEEYVLDFKELTLINRNTLPQELDEYGDPKYSYPDNKAACITASKPDIEKIKLANKEKLKRISNIGKENTKEFIRKQCKIYYKLDEDAEICSNYLGKIISSKDKNYYIKTSGIAGACDEETEDLVSCFKKVEKICFSGSYDNFDDYSICSLKFETCNFGGLLQWQRNGYLSLRDCINGRTYAWDLCDKRFKDIHLKPEEKYKWHNCLREVEKAWKASETTKEKNYSTNTNPYSKHSKCMNASDFQGCMNYYSGKTYSPPPSNNRSNTNGFQIWQDSINSQKELRRKFKMDNLEYRIDKMETDALRNRLFP